MRSPSQQIGCDQQDRQAHQGKVTGPGAGYPAADVMFQFLPHIEHIDHIVAVLGVGDMEDVWFTRLTTALIYRVSLLEVGISLASGVASAVAQPSWFKGAR